MIFFMLLCNILIIPLVRCDNVDVGKTSIGNKTTIKLNNHKEKLANETKVTLPSEGGSILPETSVMALSKSNRTMLIPILSGEPGKSKIHPRKGAVYVNNSTKSVDSSKDIIENSTAHVISSTPRHINNSSISELKKPQNVLKHNSTLVENVPIVNKTETPKKPLILKSEELENITVKTSQSTTLNNKSQDIKTYLTNANSHPGMVMPIVITILLVPMFAVLGYMALRRGQEAWKNRHYKRMDFLLDGMYND